MSFAHKAFDLCGLVIRIAAPGFRCRYLSYGVERELLSSEIEYVGVDVLTVHNRFQFFHFAGIGVGHVVVLVGIFGDVV